MVINFGRSITIAELWRPEMASRSKNIKFLTFCRNTTPFGKKLKFCSERIHRNTDRRFVFKFREIWPTGNRYKSSAVAEMGDRGHNKHGPKTEGSCCACYFRGGELGLRLTQYGLCRGLVLYQVASSSIQPFGFGHNRYGPITAGLCPF